MPRRRGRIARGLQEHAEPLSLLPTVDAVARNVGEEEATVVAPPDRAFAPDESFGDNLNLGVQGDDGVQGGIKPSDVTDGAGANVHGFISVGGGCQGGGGERQPRQGAGKAHLDGVSHGCRQLGGG